jgi:hypothetical protein
VAGAAELRQQRAGGFAQAALGAVADNRPADPLGGREPDPDAGLALARQGLDDHSAAGRGHALGRGEEFGAALEAIDGDGVCHRLRTCRAGLPLGGEALAALGATASQDLLPVLGRHPQAEAVAALTHQFARLIGPLHGKELRQSVMDRRGLWGSAGKRA